MICIKCGKEFNDEFNLCPNCRVELNDLNINNNKIIQENMAVDNNINKNGIDKDFYGNDFRENKNKIWIILIIIFVFVLIAFSGFCYYFSIPKNMLMFSFYKYSSKIENYFSKAYYSVSGNYNFVFNSKDLTGTNQQLLDVYNGLVLSGTYGYDFDRKITTLEFGSLYKNNTLINGNLYSEKDNYYLYLDGIYDKYLMSKQNEQGNNSINDDTYKQDYINIINGIKNSLISSIKDEYLIKTSGIYNEKKVNKITLNINKNNYNVIISDFLKFLMNDKAFIKSINNIADKDIEVEINDFLNDIDKYVYNNNINIDFYIKKITNDIIKMDVELKNSSGKDFVKISFVDNNIKLIYSDGNVTNNINLKIYNNNNKNNIYELEISNKDLIMNLKLNLSINYNKIINNKDINNNIDIAKLSDIDKQNIINNIFNKQNIQLFMNDILKITNNLHITNNSNM